MLLLSILITQISLHQSYQKQQVLTYQKAKEISELHVHIISNLRNDLDIVSSEFKTFNIEYEWIEENKVDIMVYGRISFKAQAILNVEKHSIISYNITGL